MDHLFKLKTSVMEYLSPAKRRHTVQVATPHHDPNLLQRSIQPMTDQKILKGRAVIAGRVSKRYLSPSDTKRSVRNSRRRIDNNDAYIDDLEDEQESSIEISQNVITPEDSSSQVKRPNDQDSTSNPSVEPEGSNPDDPVSFEDESELDAEAKVHQYLDRQTQLARHRNALERMSDGEWHKDETALFMKLIMRGFEPLIPSHWSFDFRTCPETVFSSNEEETLINAKSGNEFRGTNALSSLITLGGRVRALIECRKPQEQLIKKEIENYIKWSERDGGYDSKRFIPLLCIVAGQPNQDLPTISKAITDQMEFLALRHRQVLVSSPARQLGDGEAETFLREPPVVYGVIVAQCVAVFLTLDSGNLNAKPKTIAHFDFSDKNMDVWNGFAIAILVCMVRNQLMASKWEMETENEESDSDPDL